VNRQNLTVRRRFYFTQWWHFDLMSLCGNFFNHPNLTFASTHAVHRVISSTLLVSQ